MMFESLLNAVVYGIVLGSIYSLLSLGMNIIYGVMHIVNFAHGEFYSLCGYLIYFFCAGFLEHNIPPLLDPVSSMIVSVLIVFLIGLLVERSLVKPLYRYEEAEIYSILLLLAFSVLVQNVILIVFGPYYRAPPLLIQGTVRFHFLTIGYEQLLDVLIATLITITTYIWLYKTWFGKALRATSQNKEAASLMGISVKNIDTLSFGMGVVLAALAGSLYSKFTYLFPQIGWSLCLKAFAITILGGMGSIKGSFVGSFILGIGETLFSLCLPAYREAFGFLVMAFVLLFKPGGLYGKYE